MKIICFDLFMEQIYLTLFSSLFSQIAMIIIGNIVNMQS